MSKTVSSIAEGNQARRERVSSLLRRYPELLEGEIEELILFYRTAPPIDTALLTCDPEIAVKAGQFQREHRKAISRGVEAPMVLAVFVLAMALIALGFVLQL